MRLFAHAPATSSAVRELVENAGPNSWGRLFVACALYNASATGDRPNASELLLKAWKAGGYHLRLIALQMAKLNVKMLGPSERERVKDVLESLKARNPFLSSALVDALAAYGAVEPMKSRDEITSEIRFVLNRDDSTATRLARDIITNQFEEETIVGPYVEAVDALPSEDRMRLLLSAAAGSEPGDWMTDWIIFEVSKYGNLEDPAVQRTMLRYASELPRDAVSQQGVVATYVTALQACARFETSAPELRGDDWDLDIQAWRAVGRLVFELARGDDVVSAEKRVRYLWKLLLGELRGAAVDAFYALYASELLLVAGRPSTHTALLNHYTDQVRELFEWALPNRDLLTSVFRFSPASDRHQYIVRTLGRVGNADTVTLLRAYVHDEELGVATVSSIRALQAPMPARARRVADAP